MHRALATAGILISTLLLPAAAHAYVTPEELLDAGELSTRFFDPPPSKRDLEAIVEQQNQAAAERRQAELEAAMRESGALQDTQDPMTEEDLHGAAPDEPTISDPMSDTSGLSLEDQRLLERIKERQEADARAAAYQDLFSGDEALHSGAPLADTGPAAILMGIAVAGAVGETMRRVMKN